MQHPETALQMQIIQVLLQIGTGSSNIRQIPNDTCDTVLNMLAKLAPFLFVGLEPLQE